MPGLPLRCRAGAEVDAASSKAQPVPIEGGLGEHPADDRLYGSLSEPAQSQVQTLPSAPRKYSNAKDRKTEKPKTQAPSLGIRCQQYRPTRLDFFFFLKNPAPPEFFSFPPPGLLRF